MPLDWWLERRLAGRKLLRAFEDVYPQAFFIEIGANDGVENDPLRPFVTSRPWSGIMVEPVPHVFERLRRNCAGLDRVALENAAIAERDGRLPFYNLAWVDGDEVLYWFDTFGSLSRETAERTGAAFVPGGQHRVIRTEVPCLSFESLCRKHGVHSLDLLLIDTEGYDYEIIKRIDFSAHRPRLLIYEHFLLSPGERADCRKLLHRLRYETMEENRDTWCLDTRPDDRLTRKWHRLSPAIPGHSIHDQRLAERS